MAPVWKFSAPGTITTGRTLYTSMLAGNTVFNPWAPSGAYDSIATTTVGSPVSSITFSSIPQTYTHLQLRLTGASSVNQDTFFQLNGDTGNNYTRHFVYGSGSSAAAGATVSASSGSLGYLSPTSNTNVVGTAIWDLLDYRNTSKNKTSRSLTGYYSSSTGGLLVLYSSLWTNTAAVTSITIFPNPTSNFAQYTSAALYGIKGN